MTGPHAELIIHNGTIRTMDALHPTAEAVAVADGRILAVGQLESVEATAHANTRRLDLAGRTLIPGFNDAHVHLWKVGMLLTSMIDARIAATPDIPAIVAAYRARAARTPAGKWLVGRGYNNVTLPEHRHPTRHDLDQASTAHPMMLIHTSAHVAVANSRALELAGITRDTPNPPGGEIERDEHGEPTGVLHETAMNAVNRVQPPPTDSEFEAAILAAARAFLRLGITSVTEAGVSPEQLGTYRRLVAERRMPFRVNAMARRYLDDGSKVPLPERFESNWLRIDTVKLFADGGLSSGNAALTVPYPGQHGHEPGYSGLLRATQEQMRAQIWDIHRAGLRAAIHAVGDAAIGQVIEAIEYASQRLVSRIRHRIEHFGLPSADHIRRCRYRISVVPQPIFIHALGSTFLNYVPAALMRQLYPLRALLDGGLTVALSSDAPVVPDANPLLGMKAAAARLSAEGTPLAPEQAVPIAETLPLYTLGGALVAGEEHLKGSIEPGKYADFAVLSGDPLRAPAERLTDLKVEMTLVNGQIVYST
jgi:predicted amidohydrolase YtcJ